MRIVQGKSVASDAQEAVAEATRDVGSEAPSMVFAFVSTAQDPVAVAARLAERFPSSPIAGCTTAGEIVDGAQSTGALVVSAIVSPEVRWAAEELPPLAGLDRAGAERVVDALFAKLGTSRETIDPRRHFAICLLDGLAMKEEHVASLVADALEGIPLVGGSAGDDLAFRATRTIVGGKAREGAGVLVVAETALPFRIVKHQHYGTTDRELVVTRADVETRRVHEIDGLVAIEAYAAALGLRREEVTDEVTFANPLTFAYAGEVYVRSIRSIEPDGSLTFLCGIEEGMVLALGDHEPLAPALERDLGDGFERAELFVAFNCILRALEARKHGLQALIESTLRARARHVVGFDTYGEQLQGVHINQTLVGIAIGVDE